MTVPSFFSSHNPVATISAIALCTALLSAAAGLADARRQALPRPALATVTLLLAATGLWWPVQAMLLDGQAEWGRSERSALAWLFAIAPLAAARAVAPWAERRTMQLFGLGVVGVALLCCLVLVIGFPNAFGADAVARFVGTLLVCLAMAAGLLALELAPRLGMHTQLARVGVALALALLMTAVAAASVPASRTGLGFAVWPASLVLLLLAGLAMALRFVLTRSEPAAPAASVSQKASASQPGPARQAVRTTQTTDNLTQLPTRVYFEQRLALAAARCDAGGGRLALLFIDLDGFKPVNDTFGHSHGDHVLIQVGERLKALSSGGNVVARIGGDEFLMLVAGAPTVESVNQIASELITSVSRPYAVDDREVIISCSVGVAFYPENGELGKLIARADAAMYAAKRTGGSCCSFYTEAMDADSREQFDLLGDLRLALASNNQLELFYQPKIDAQSGQVTACEALLRWKHPKRGIVLPGAFIPIAERFGLIGALGNWVIEDACRQARHWHDNGLRMRVAINLSAQQMRQEDIIERLVGALERYHIHPSLLTCEITESVAMEDTRATQNAVRRLGEAGIHLSIDDFGTGYSSLSYLRQLPAEELKIDRSFVQDVERSADARSVVDAVVKLAHALGLRVVAEGVENAKQRQILVAMECDELQGFLFAKPMSARALLLWAIEDKTVHAAFRPSLFGDTAHPSQL